MGGNVKWFCFRVVNGRLKTISGHLFGNYINIFHKMRLYSYSCKKKLPEMVFKLPFTICKFSERPSILGTYARFAKKMADSSKLIILQILHIGQCAVKTYWWGWGSFGFLVTLGYSCYCSHNIYRWEIFTLKPRPSLKIWPVNKFCCFDIDNGLKNTIFGVKLLWEIFR